MARRRRKRERLPGGRASGLPASAFDRRQLELGTRVELEHTGDLEIAREIAMDHLAEIPDYYTRLLRMEQEAEADMPRRQNPEGNPTDPDTLRERFGRDPYVYVWHLEQWHPGTIHLFRPVSGRIEVRSLDNTKGWRLNKQDIALGKIVTEEELVATSTDAASVPIGMPYTPDRKRNQAGRVYARRVYEYPQGHEHAWIAYEEGAPWNQPLAFGSTKKEAIAAGKRALKKGRRSNPSYGGYPPGSLVRFKKHGGRKWRKGTVVRDSGLGLTGRVVDVRDEDGHTHVLDAYDTIEPHGRRSNPPAWRQEALRLAHYLDREGFQESASAIRDELDLDSSKTQVADLAEDLGSDVMEYHFGHAGDPDEKEDYERVQAQVYEYADKIRKG